MSTLREPTVSAPIAVPGDLGWNLAMVLRGYQQRFEAAVDGLPGGVRGYQVLSTVIHRDLPSQQAIGAHLAIDRTVLTYLLDGMVEAGLVARIPDPTDRRARKIVATDAGTQELTRYESRVATAEAGVLAGLPGEDAQALAPGRSDREPLRSGREAHRTLRPAKPDAPCGLPPAGADARRGLTPVAA